MRRCGGIHRLVSGWEYASIFVEGPFDQAFGDRTGDEMDERMEKRFGNRAPQSEPFIADYAVRDRRSPGVWSQGVVVHYVATSGGTSYGADSSRQRAYPALSRHCLGDRPAGND